MDHDTITIRGARQHNLKNIDLVLPRYRLIVITGVSGSGKSSLAFDTLFAEGQRRYMEALSTHARQVLHQLPPPDVDVIEGLSPAIAIEQKGLPRNPRSTVGTLTEIHDFLRILFSRLGTLYCPECNLPVKAYSTAQMVEEALRAFKDRERLFITAPLGRIKENELARRFKEFRRDGFARVRLDGTLYELDPPPHVPRRPTYELDVVVDRVVLDRTKPGRLLESLELAAGIGKGIVRIVSTEGTERVYSEFHTCLSCGRKLTSPTPSLFSFHHPAGACPRCKGLGFLPEPAAPAPRGVSPRSLKDSPEKPVLPSEEDEDADDAIECPECRGSRFNRMARSVRFGGFAIDQVSGMTLLALKSWIESLSFSTAEEIIAERPREEIRHRLSVLSELGLSYLSLDRSAHTLSGGEAQRIRLAHQISAPLSGILYVLDEPSIGLHPRDHQQLLDVIQRLRDARNTVIVVEHDRQTILQADYVVDIGPGAGSQGGEVVFAGTPQDLLSHSNSITGQYLSGRKVIPAPFRRNLAGHGVLRLVGARGHNLKNLTVELPLGAMTCITGVSGSGKSTLVLDTLYRALAQRLYGARRSPAPYDRLEGAESIRKVSLVDQAPIGRTPRSIPATVTELFPLIRRLFSQLPESRARGYSANRFSFNVKGGRCEACKGEGMQRVEMFFLPDVYVTCPICGGSRFSWETLEIRFKGHSIAQVLDMSVHEAAAFFENLPAIRSKLEALQEVGLGYLRLGQPATTLSGGEAQRVKLASELGHRGITNALYILDEPTTGLHFEDIRNLLHALHRLVEQGNTVVMIEHHPDVIKAADRVIDLGPGGGEDGGTLVAVGTPEEVAAVEASFTGRYLREILGGAGEADSDQLPKDR